MHRKEKNSNGAVRLIGLSPLHIATILLFSICISSDADDLATLLVSPNYKTRRQAEEKLLGLGHEALPICLRMAGDNNLASKFCAARVLRKLVSNGLGHQEITALKKSTFPELRSIYYSVLPDSKEGIKELLSGAQATQREIRLASLNRLIELKAPFNPQPLLTMLEGLAPDDPHRARILSALIQATPSPEWKTVAKNLTDPNAETVVAAAHVLGRWKAHGSAKKLYSTAIASSRDRIRHASFSALAAIGDEGKALILKDCTSQQGNVREQAGLALGFFPGTHSQLLGMLKNDPYERVAQAASISLGRLYNKDQPQYFFPYDASSADRARVVEAWKQFITKTKD